MIEFVCVFFPALFSVFALERLLSKKLNLRNFAMVFVTNTICINIVGLFVMFCVSGTSVMPLSTENGLNINYSLVYLTVTSVVSIFVVLAERFYFYTLRIGVTDDKKKSNNDKADV